MQIYVRSFARISAISVRPCQDQAKDRYHLRFWNRLVWFFKRFSVFGCRSVFSQSMFCLFLNRINWTKRVVSRFPGRIPREQAVLSIRRNPTFSCLHGQGSPRTDGVRLSEGCADHVHAREISLLRGLSTLEGNVSLCISFFSIRTYHCSKIKLIRYEI